MKTSVKVERLYESQCHGKSEGCSRKEPDCGKAESEGDRCLPGS